MNDIASLFVRVDSTQVVTLDGVLNKVSQSAEEAQKSTTGLSTATDILAKAAQYAASAFGLYKLTSLITEATLLAARYETMGTVMRVAGNNAGYSMDQMMGFSKSLQESGISMLKSRDSLTQLATAHIDLTNASKLARAAQDLAVVGNINSSEAFGRLIQGIKSGETEILRTLGLNVRFDDGYKQLAKTLGVTTASLTEQQKVQARTNIALQEAASYSGIYEQSMGTAGKAMQSLTRYFEDFKVMVGDAFLPALARGVFLVLDSMKALNKELSVTTGVADFGKLLAGGFDLIVAAALPAIKITAAYFALFVGIPAIISAVTIGFNAAAGAVALFAYNQVFATTGAVGLNTVLFGTSVAAELAAGSLGMLGLAAGVLFAAFAGWEIGKYLRENFEEAQLAGIAFVEGTLVAWENVKYGGELAWLAIKSAFNSMVEIVGMGLTTIFDGFASGLRAVGLTTMADSISNLSSKIKDATKSTTSFDEESAKLKTQLDKNVSSVRDITGEMANEASAHFRSKDAVAAHAAENIKHADTTKKSTELTKEQTAALKKHEDQIKKLVGGIDEKILTMKAETESTVKLTEAEKLEIKITADLLAGTISLNYEETQEILTKLEQLDAAEKLVIARRKEVEETKEATKAYADLIESSQKSVDSTQQEIYKLQEHITTMFMTKEELASYTNQKMLDKAASLEMKATWVEESMLGTELAQQFRDQAKGLRDLAALKQDGIHVQAAKDAAVAWAETTRQIGTGLSSALYDSVRDGKDIWLTFRDYMVKTIIDGTIKNALASVITNGLNSLIAGITGIKMPGVSGVPGLGSTLIDKGVNAVTGGTGGVSGLIDSGVNAITGGTGGVSGAISSIGSALGFTGSGTAAAGTTVATSSAVTGGSTLVATDLGLLGSGSAAGGSAAAGSSAAATTGSFLATAGPIAAAIATFAIMNSMNDKDGLNYWLSYDATGKAGNVPDVGIAARLRYGQNRPTMDAMAAEYVSTAKSLGITPEAGSFGFDSGSDGTFNMGATFDGAHYRSGWVPNNAETMTWARTRALFSALQASEKPQSIAQFFDGIDAGLTPLDDLKSRLASAAAAPKFAMGGMFGGGMRWVGENGPELEITGPSRIMNSGQIASAITGTQSSGSDEVTRTLLSLILAEMKRTANAVNGDQEAPMQVEQT